MVPDLLQPFELIKGKVAIDLRRQPLSGSKKENFFRCSSKAMVSSIRPDRSCTMGNQGVMDLAWQDFFKLRNQGWQIEFDRIP
jgi:hypothetical protein